ncbi:DUF6510 family protein [Micromonospora zhanjiangensis]|uniref:DUF6510 family protein n=1 Tax=Micromonospora zhanjiangensis TaxID=1522057 RepID=A0ABV8KTV5_9ACTN
MIDEQYLDGNQLAGPLRDVFAVEVSAADCRCASCGLTGPLATLRVYAHAPGLVARCPGCGEVMLRLVRAPTDAWLDLRGSVFLRIPLPPDPVGPVEADRRLVGEPVRGLPNPLDG